MSIVGVCVVCVCVCVCVVCVCCDVCGWVVCCCVIEVVSIAIGKCLSVCLKMKEVTR